MIRLGSAIAILLLLTVPEVFSRELLHPFNLDFEEGSRRGMPSGWYMPTFSEKNNYNSEISSENPASGKYCLKLYIDSVPSQDIYGSVMQSIDAEPYRGKKIRFRAAVRVELKGDSSTGHLWVRAHRKDDQNGFFDMMEDRPIVLGNWEFYEITGEIDENADKINFGLMLKGAGKAWIDAASFEIFNEYENLYEKPYPLSENEAENLMVFAKALRYVRFFYPGTEAAETDWNRFALDGVSYIKDAEKTDELIDKLNTYFKPAAPGILFHSKDSASVYSYYDSIPENSLENTAIGMIHTGLSLTGEDNIVFGGGPFNIYRSVRSKDGIALQFVNPSRLKGKSAVFEVYVKTELIPPAGQAQIVAAVEFEDEKPPLVTTAPYNSIKTAQWKKYSIRFQVPPDAQKIRLGLVLIGDGRVMFDDASLRELKNGKPSGENLLKNPGFEKDRGRKLVYGWKSMNADNEREYFVNIVSKGAYEGKQCLEIVSDPDTRVKFPKAGSILGKSLSKNISFNMPLVLYADSSGTLPHTQKPKPEITNSLPEDFIINSRDRSSRLAAVILTWGILRQFSIFNDSEEEWDAALNNALKSASEDSSTEQFLITLEKLSAHLNDCQTRVWSEKKQIKAAYPFLWKLIDGKVFVTKTSPDFNLFFPGDVIEKINGVPISNLMRAAKQRISGAGERWKNLRALAELRAGNLGSVDTLQINPYKREPFSVPVERTIYFTELKEERPPAFYKIPGTEIFYLDLTRLDDSQIKDTAVYMRFAEKIIFDMRGYTPVSEHFLGLFTDKPLESVIWEIPVVTGPGSQYVSKKIMQSTITPLPLQLTKDIVFLADERTVGYAEGILSVVKHYGIGRIIGRPTAGTPGEVSVLRIPADYFISMTSMYGRSPGGDYIHGRGVPPDILVESSVEAQIKDEDEILNKALEILTEKGD